MLILAAGDFHGNLQALHHAVEAHAPDLLLSPGDWGDAGQVSEAEWQALLDVVPVLTVTGNHDDRSLLERLTNRDGSPVLLGNGRRRQVADLSVAGISGIWAKTRLGSRLNERWERAQRRDPGLTLEEFMAGQPFPPYITDAEVDALAAALAGESIDVLITHGAPIGVADTTPGGGRGGNACFRRALAAVKPGVHLCGHLHRLQRADSSGVIVLNSGDGAAGDGWLLRWDGKEWDVRNIAEA